MNKFKIFTTPRYCADAETTGAPVYVAIGDLIVYSEEYVNGSGRRLARVLGIVNQFDNGVIPKEEHLVVLAANDALDFGYERYVPLNMVRTVTGGGDFAKFFLFGEMPLPEVAIAVIKYGAMNNRIEKYLEDGELKASFRNVDKVAE